MSKILKGLNESNYRKYDDNRTGFSRGQRDDERHDLDVQQPSQQQWALKINGKVWSKDGKAVTFNSREQALKARLSLLAKRPELEVGLVTRGGVAETRIDELSNEKLAQYKTAAALDAGKADKENDYKRGDKRFSGIVKATKKQFANDTKKSAINQGVSETLGDQLKSSSLDALQKVKQQIEQNNAEQLQQWKQDFETNMAAKFKGRQQPEATPVAQPGEKHSVLKARLVQLDSAIKKQAFLDKLMQRIESKGLMNPEIQNAADTRMHVKYGAKDNYQTLNKKLDDAISMIKNRLAMRKLSGLKEGGDRDEYYNPRMGHEYGKGNLFVDPGSNEFEKNVPAGEPGGPRGKPKSLKGISKTLPADAFGRTTGKIPAGKPGRIHSMMNDVGEELDENLHKWFKEKWVRFGPDGKIRGDCARGDDSEGKPKCLPQSKAQNLGKKGRASAAARKRREDPNPERSGKAINVNTKKKSNEGLSEGSNNIEVGDKITWWYNKFHPNYEGIVRRVAGSTIDVYAPGSGQMYRLTKDDIRSHEKKSVNEAELDEACWKGYHKEGNKKMFGKTYPNCVKNTNEEQELNEFAPDGFNGNDGEEFNPNLAKMAQEDGFTKGASLADGATTQRAMAINDWDKHDGGIYSQHFAKGFIAGRKDKIRHNNKQYNLNLKLMKDGSIRHGEQGVAEGLPQTLRKFVPGYAKREIDKKMDAGKFGKTDADKDANFQRYKKIQDKLKEQGVAEGDVVPFKQKNPLTPNLIKQLKALSQQALELFWEGSSVPTAAQGQIAQIGKNEEQRMFKQNEAQFKALGYGYSIFEDDMDILFLHSIAREAWYEADKPANMYRGLPDLQYNAETNTLSYYDLIGDDGYEYTDNTQFEGVAEDQLDEKWTKKYKDSINCSNPKGFSQKAHCAGKQKNESAIMKGLK